METSAGRPGPTSPLRGAPDADRVCTLVIIGVCADGKKELVALTDGHRESAESWAGLRQ
jgi:transposase-like protein